MHWVATGELINPVILPRFMAKRKYNQKARALQPAVMKLNFVVDAPGAAGYSTSYISISHCVSQLNRRFYRQGLNWAVANVKVTMQPAAAGGSTYTLNTIPHTWSVANAWQKTFSLWKKQQDEALEATDSLETVARYRDFKISMEEGHVVGTDLRPVNLGPGRNPLGPIPLGILASEDMLGSEEWVSSEIVIPNDGGPGVAGQYDLHMVGPDAGAPVNSKGMIHGYQESRATPTSPDPSGPIISGSFLAEMFDVGSTLDEVAVNAQNRNDELPYDQDEYPGGSTNFVELETQGYAWNQSTVGINSYNSGPFTAPCGLLRIDFSNQAPQAGTQNHNYITVTLVPGNHRGYLAETMGEF